jgi:hypothetical protein
MDADVLGVPFTNIEVSSDGLTMYFSSDRLNAADRDIYTTTRPDRGSSWAAPQRVDELSTTGLDDDSAELLGDGRHLVMSKGTQPALDLMLATRASVADPWGAPAQLPGLADPAYDESQQWGSPDRPSSTSCPIAHPARFRTSGWRPGRIRSRRSRSRG